MTTNWDIDENLDTFFRHAVSRSRAQKEQHAGKFLQQTFAFARIVKANPMFTDADPADVADLLEVVSREFKWGCRETPYGVWDDCFDLDDLENGEARIQFVANFQRVRWAGTSLPDRVLANAKALPVKLFKRYGPFCEELASVGYHLQLLNPGQKIKLPIELWTKLLGAKNLMTISRCRQFLVERGILLLKEKHVPFSKSTGFVFDLTLFDSERRELPRREEVVKEMKEIKEVKETKEDIERIKRQRNESRKRDVFVSTDAVLFPTFEGRTSPNPLRAALGQPSIQSIPHASASLHTEDVVRSGGKA